MGQFSVPAVLGHGNRYLEPIGNVGTSSDLNFQYQCWFSVPDLGVLAYNQTAQQSLVVSHVSNHASAFFAANKTFICCLGITVKFNQKSYQF